MFIGLMGLMGAGKSSLAVGLGELRGHKHLLEPVDSNPYLSMFYDEPEKYAFVMQIELLNQRYHLHKYALFLERSTKGVVQDRTIYEDWCFAFVQNKMGYINDLAFSTYEETFNNMMESVRAPQMLVYLKTDPDVALHRIHNIRKRPCESGVTLEYLQRLQIAYDEMLRRIQGFTNIITVDYNTFRSPEYINNMIEIESERLGLNNPFKQRRKMGDF